MKKAAVPLFALLLGLALAMLVFRAFLAWQEARYLDSAEAFVAAVVEPLLREWDVRTLREHGSIALLQSMPGNDLDRQVRGFSRLGPLRKVHGVESRLEGGGLPFAGESPPRVHVQLDATFSKARATAEIELVLRQGQWKIDGLRIPTPLLAE